MKQPSLILPWLLATALAAKFVAASEDADEPEIVSQDEEEPIVVKPQITTFKPTSIKAPFLEQFTDDWASRWIPSQAKKVVDGVEDEDLLRFRGQWAVEIPETPGIAEDAGLVVKTAAAHHAISAKFRSPVDSTGKDFVVQYEVKLQNGLECGGAYLKLLTANDSFVPEKFDDKTPYTIMFGPDKCGYTNKVHFIFRHKNPLTGVYEEKHFNSPPAAKIDKFSNLYTLIVRSDNSFEILINNDNAAKGTLLTDFNPPVNPPAEVDDPEDKKPSDWVEEAKIPDPEATKPSDWDEDAPFEILDESATKPEDWLDDEPLYVPDPDAVKPEDWDDEEDGDWSAPQVSNPKCAKISGCGEWKRPNKKNPDYKGKWKAPLIDNPAYKGVWAPRKIPNPDYFKDEHPSNFEKIGAIGVELWTMQDGILFDNVYVGNSIEDAKALAEETWEVKRKAEEKTEDIAEEKKKDTKGAAEESPVLGFPTSVDEFIIRFNKFLNLFGTDRIAALTADPYLTAILAAIALVPIGLLSLALLPAKPKIVKEKKEEKSEKKEAEKESEKEEEPKVVKKEGSTATKRSKKKGAASNPDDN